MPVQTFRQLSVSKMSVGYAKIKTIKEKENKK